MRGIGRFIFNGVNGVDSLENITKKADLCKQSALLALASRYTNEPYPLERIKDVLKEFKPELSESTKDGLNRVYLARKSTDAKIYIPT